MIISSFKALSLCMYLVYGVNMHAAEEDLMSTQPKFFYSMWVVWVNIYIYIYL